MTSGRRNLELALGLSIDQSIRISWQDKIDNVSLPYGKCNTQSTHPRRGISRHDKCKRAEEWKGVSWKMSTIMPPEKVEYIVKHTGEIFSSLCSGKPIGRIRITLRNNPLTRATYVDQMCIKSTVSITLDTLDKSSKRWKAAENEWGQPMVWHSAERPSIRFPLVVICTA